VLTVPHPQPLSQKEKHFLGEGREKQKSNFPLKKSTFWERGEKNKNQTPL
jgi:hypothetical protein